MSVPAGVYNNGRATVVVCLGCTSPVRLALTSDAVSRMAGKCVTCGLRNELEVSRASK